LTGLVRKADVIHVAGPCLLPMLLGLALRKLVVVEHHGYQAVCPNGLLLYEPTKKVCPGHFMVRQYHKCLQCNAATMGWAKSALELLLAFPRRWACKRAALNVAISRHVDGRVRLPRSAVIYYGIHDPLDGKTSVAGGTPMAPRCSEHALAVSAQGRDSDRSRQAALAGPSWSQPSTETTVTFAYVGRLVSEKGLPLLVEAARRLDAEGYSFRLMFVGDGPERSRLEEQVDALGLHLRVRFTGYLQGEALASALDGVSAVVMPSIWEETAGLSAIEHMMRGRVVIASDIGGLGEVVDGAGLKFTAGDAVGLTSCLQCVLEDPQRVELLGMKARERALRLFSLPRMIREHLALYRELQGESGGSPVFVREEG
jgi:glycosyltransferase involved in cell wall biosynthesis